MLNMFDNPDSQGVFYIWEMSYPLRETKYLLCPGHGGPTPFPPKAKESTYSQTTCQREFG
jgi:hypothetical protein